LRHRRLVEVERLSHDCVLAEHTFHAINNPVTAGRQRASGLRFADPKIRSCRSSSCSGKNLLPLWSVNPGAWP
jgi:hypothetical protein